MSERVKRFDKTPTIPDGGFEARVIVAIPSSLEHPELTATVDMALAAMRDIVRPHESSLVVRFSTDVENERIMGSGDEPFAIPEAWTANDRRGLTRLFEWASRQSSPARPTLLFVFDDRDLSTGELQSVVESEVLTRFSYSGAVQHWCIGDSAPEGWKAMERFARRDAYGCVGIVVGPDLPEYPRGADAAIQYIEWFAR